ncbi:hypothetical protein Vretimale_13249 [Volvox reticuliferus]|uniref:CBM20 domain-containing protein n=1 Tax=Volvox reticuliferus TaxID=1737510 RepID=A0A8J4FTT8_9CHLO|nr:hypothetical protein Vretifemale_14185 [Volvox reticuliferus]GIM09381.1 hypothetical protein Vretimale_13249 [Volvox reticuliferus]
MALTCLKARAIASTGQRIQRLPRCVVRAQADSSSTTVNFKVHRHVEFGQSLLLVGSAPELGSWDAKHALELNWGEGDNWSASAALPVGSSLEYKYIIKRRDGLDWCPGQNKAIALPSAASVEVTDTWENTHGTVVALKPLEVAPAVEEAPIAPAALPVAEGEAPLVAEATPHLPETNLSLIVPQLTAGSCDTLEAATAVSTVENLHVPELEKNGVPTPAVLAAQHQQPPGLLANNIVQGVPLGAVAVTSDPITQYEEADKYQVVEVGSTEKAVLTAGLGRQSASSSSSAGASATAKSMDKMTMAELRSEVKRRGMSPLGNRRELLTRLQNAGVL